MTWKWKSPGYRSQFTSEHVNVLRAMVARHYKTPHRFICVTDDPEGLDDGIEPQPIDNRWADIPNPTWSDGPSCYRRLALFAPDAGDRFGKRYVSLDLDAVVIGDLAPLWDRPEPIVLWGDPNFDSGILYCGSMVLMDAGAAPQVYEDFDPEISPKRSHAARHPGSDQGWIAHKLGPGQPVWTQQDGIYSYWRHIQMKRLPLPGDARIVFFHGRVDPWSPEAQQHDWVREHWRR